MAREVFNYPVKVGAQGPVKFRTSKVRFGDGYAQYVGDGLNNRYRTWNLSANGPLSSMQPIMDFIDRQQGYLRFDWTPPFGGIGIWVCEEGYTPVAGVGDETSLTFTFTEVFQP